MNTFGAFCAVRSGGSLISSYRAYNELIEMPRIRSVINPGELLSPLMLSKAVGRLGMAV